VSARAHEGSSPAEDFYILILFIQYFKKQSYLKKIFSDLILLVTPAALARPNNVVAPHVLAWQNPPR
jgi:hypothetical protein